MKRLTLVLSLVLLAGMNTIQAQSTNQKDTVVFPPKEDHKGNADAEDGIYSLVDQQPSFPGGEQALAKFLRENTNYPKKESKKGIKGKVYVSFTVDKTGKIRDVYEVRGVPDCPGLTTEAIRVISAMPDWTPGKSKGKPVNCTFTIPINFNFR